MTSQEQSLPRVRRLSDALADQIAAGEVIERPASVVKELVDNAIDAGARRVDVELVAGGTEAIVVVDDGHGIHPDDLELALTRHATSKLRRAADLTEIETLGFRGEALASIAAVAKVRVRSRRRGEPMGRVVDARAGGVQRIEPTGMAVGTRIEVRNLFENVPARRKFLRSEATEVGHVTEAMVRLALVHPQVRLTLRHGRRTLLELSPADAGARVAQLLERRGGREPVRAVEGEHDGVRVRAWLMDGTATSRRAGVMVVVRRRVVRENNLAKIVTAVATEVLGGDGVACLWVEPEAGDVDVNVHPQKAEIRFGDPQRVYAAVREVLSGWVGEVAPVRAPNSSGVSAGRASLADALSGWGGASLGSGTGTGTAARGRAGGYRLGTRAAAFDYGKARDEMRAEAEALGNAIARTRVLDERAAPVEVAPEPVGPPEPTYLGCLPGPVGLFRAEDDLLAVDLRTLRAHLVYRRLAAELGGEGIGAQALLQPAVVSLPATDVQVVAEHGDALAPLGLVLEAFGEDSVMVRAVPAQLRRCVDELDVGDLVQRVLPWLRVRSAAPGSSPSSEADAIEALSSAGGASEAPAPRLARAWIRELLEAGDDLDRVPGITRWRAHDLVRATKGSR